MRRTVETFLGLWGTGPYYHLDVVHCDRDRSIAVRTLIHEFTHCVIESVWKALPDGTTKSVGQRVHLFHLLLFLSSLPMSTSTLFISSTPTFSCPFSRNLFQFPMSNPLANTSSSLRYHVTPQRPFLLPHLNLQAGAPASVALNSTSFPPSDTQCIFTSPVASASLGRKLHRGACVCFVHDSILEACRIA